MTKRTTFVHRDPSFNPQSLQLTTHSLGVTNLVATREERFRFEIDKIPGLLRLVLRRFYNGFHVRWVSTKSRGPLAPYAAKMPPGLHILVDPRVDEADFPICDHFLNLFDGTIPCESLEKTFVHGEAGWQFYTLLRSLAPYESRLATIMCRKSQACLDAIRSGTGADYIDLDFDGQTLVVSVVSSPSAEGWSYTITSDGDHDVQQTGILAEEVTNGDHEVKIGGYLAPLPLDEARLQHTLFSFPSRHHLSKHNYKVDFVQPTGLHPKVRIRFTDVPFKSPPSNQCKLNAYFTLPSSLFVDKYQLSDPLFLASNGLRNLTHVSGETDLEAPVWAVTKWGSIVLLELDLENPNREVDIPLHLRYLPPVSGGDLRDVEMPWPTVFWSCSYTGEKKISQNPFDRKDLGFDALFPKNTVFHHLSPWTSQDRVETLHVPVLALDRTKWVASGTSAVILLGFAWLCWVLAKPYLRSPSPPPVEKKKKEN